MKKTNQTDLDFDMINLDETAGWNKLELESALEEKEESLVFQGEVTISEEELFAMETMDTYTEKEEIEYLDDEDESLVCAEEDASTCEEEYLDDEDAEYAEEYEDEEDAVFSEEEYLDEQALTVSEKKSTKSSKGKKKRKQPVTLLEKAQASFRNMSALDGIIAVTGVMVLVVAIVTVSIFSGAKMAEQQVEAFAPIGEEMEYLADAGKGTLLAMADAHKLIQDEETEEEMTFEYEEKELDVDTINVNMKMTSVQKDLKIKFVNHKTGKLIPNVKFKISVEDAKGKVSEYTDDDMDGIIYLKDMTPGNATVTMLALSGETGLAFNTAAQTIKIKDQIEYTKIDVSDEVKTESEVNAAIEDTAQEMVVEGELTDTVEWVASTKTEVDTKESYEKVDKSTIADPASTAKAAFVRMTQILDTTVEKNTDEESSTPESSTPESSTPESSTPESSTPESSTPESSTPESSTPESSTPESSTPESSTPESSTPESSTPESTTPESSTTETTTPESTEETKNSAEKDTVSLLKDKSGNQMYLKNSNGDYVEAKYADYYNSKAVFYKKVKTSGYKYTGWQNIDGKTYFYDKNGKVVTGEQVIQGAKYNFASDGALITGSGTLGIDVSKWNGSIDWSAVKNSGISYVIIRCGYRGSTTGAMIEDPKFKTNVKGANAAGLKVGIYFFSQAVNEVEAVEEASMTISLIKNYSISYPVFLDVEASGGRGDAIDRNTRTKVIKAYCETIRNSGYTAGVYANKTWLNSYMNVGELSSYKIWLAQYNSTVTYSGRYDLWQYSDKGKINGISGNTDMNLSYLGY